MEKEALTNIQQQAKEELQRREGMRKKLVQADPADNDELISILKATNKEKPAKADLQRLENYFMQHPTAVAKLGNLANQAQISIVDHAFKNSEATAISVESYMADLRLDMGWDNASLIERSLIDNVALCWLRLYVTELRYETVVHGGNVSLTQAAFWEKALSANQKRYLRAVETLARVRRLMKDPPSQMTLALVKQQINATAQPVKKLSKWLK